MDDLIAIEKSCREFFAYPHMQLWDKAKLAENLGSEIYTGALFDANSGHLHPLNYCLGLAKACLALGVEIYEQSPAVDLRIGKAKVKVKTDQSSVIAKDLVLATNAYIRVLPKSYIVVLLAKFYL